MANKIYFYHEPAFDFEDEREAILAPVEVSKKGILTQEQSYRLFRKMNCLKYLEYMEDNVHEKADLASAAARVRNVIATHNLGLVKNVAHKLRPYDQWDTYAAEEMICEGEFWLLRAIDCFNYRQHSKFSSYASIAVARKIMLFLDESKESPNQFPEDFEPAEPQDAFRWVEMRLGLESVREMIEKHVPFENAKRILGLRLGLVDESRWSFQKIAADFGGNEHATSVLRKFNYWCEELFGKTLSDKRAKE